ncbi:MAG: hypothetical protein J1F16_00135 [Muribaculaceae bacterium]|nr:hypothetical protein [Muribaculaceae bacterium]
MQGLLQTEVTETKNNKPVFKHYKIWYAVSAILTIPLLIDICTACHLFTLWIAWLLFFLICIISFVRLWFAFKQHLYKFAWGLIAQLLLGAGVLIFFQLSYNRVIETPVSNPVTPAVVNIVNPIQALDSVHKTNTEKNELKSKDNIRKTE